MPTLGRFRWRGYKTGPLQNGPYAQACAQEAPAEARLRRDKYRTRHARGCRLEVTNAMRSGTLSSGRPIDEETSQNLANLQGLEMVSKVLRLQSGISDGQLARRCPRFAAIEHAAQHLGGRAFGAAAGTAPATTRAV